ncbi:MAG: ATPase, T2SS/T4P/T4SS family [Chloroflexi bacterium]|nr:ATPase, T2SS/T4P/T4SS family [Chloroflexota bacterium]
MTSAIDRADSREGVGDLLVEMGRITPQQLAEALGVQRRENQKLADVLVEQGLVTQEDVAMALSLHLNIPIIDLKRHTVAPEALRMIPEGTARRYNLVPLDVVADSLVVVMEDPRDIAAIEDLVAQSKMRIQPTLGVPAQIQEAIDLSYRASDEIREQVSAFASLTEGPIEAEVETSESMVAQAPIVRTLDLIMAQAVRDRASDIHIEPQDSRVRIRYRIDGVLHDAMSLPRSALDPLVSRIKILAEMNITEHRRPQDGQFSIGVGDRDVDIRAATADTEHGETAVLRILDKSMALFALPELGFLPEALKKYQVMLRSAFGMILIGGPTGSGTTTTLYASVNQLDRNERNIVTIEDPVEYRFMDIKQIQVNEKAGTTFASGLRSIMRLDPDIILVGEIRDGDTAKTAVQAALTGHLVLSSIHANDAASVTFRLLDLGVDPYLISSVLIGILAQRMVRRTCLRCRVSYDPSTEERTAYEQDMPEETTTYYQGAGCNFCSDTGYHGRTGVFELLPFSAEIRRALIAGASVSDIKTEAIKKGMVTLRRDGMMKVKEGITTPNEVLRNVFSIG